MSASHHPIDGLAPETPFADAAAKMVWTRFGQMWRHRDATIAGDVDALHDMRVGSRRLRAALEMAAPAFSGTEHRRFRRVTEQLTETLGAVRDHDVMLQTLERLGAESGGDGLQAAAALSHVTDAVRLVERQRLVDFFDDLAAAGYAETARRLWHRE